MTNYRVAVPKWIGQDDISDMMAHELRQLGHESVQFCYTEPVPKPVDVLLTFGPYDKILPVWERAVSSNNNQKPVVVHWNTEGMPDIRIPYGIIRRIGAMRSWLGRLKFTASPGNPQPAHFSLLSWLDHRMMRYRYVGDYHYAYEKGLLNILADSSKIYSDIRSRAGLPTIYAPWGGSKILYNDLELARDIDVIWLGKRGTTRRRRILDQVCRELQDQGVKVYLADNEENPFIFGDVRTEYLNRAKITLNITRTWFDDNYSRFVLAAPNGSLIISEPVLPHCLQFKANVHYVSTPISELSNAILYYLEHEAERQQIIDQAYQLVTHELIFLDSVKKMMEAVEQVKS